MIIGTGLDFKNFNIDLNLFFLCMLQSLLH